MAKDIEHFKKILWNFLILLLRTVYLILSEWLGDLGI